MNERLKINVRYCSNQSSLQKNLSEGIGSPPIPVLVVEDLKMNALLRICGPPIQCSAILKALHTSYCKAAKKPTKGNEYEMEINIECKGVVFQIAWRMTDKIKR